MKFTGRLKVSIDGEEDIIPIYDAEFKENKIIEVSMEKFKNDCPCVLERRNCEITIGETLIRKLENEEKDKALQEIKEYVEDEVIDLIYE